MIKRGAPPEGYYTASQAKKRLGDITDGMLRSYVQKGRIEKFVPSGKSQGFYKKEHVDTFALLLDGFPEKEPSGTIFEQAKLEDLPELVDFLIGVFGGYNTLENRESWYKKNPETAFIVRTNKKIVGCVYIFPLSEEKIREVLDDKTSGSTRSIKKEDIYPVPERGAEVNFYIASMAAKDKTSLKAKRIRGQILVRGLIKEFIRLGEKGVKIKMLAARSNSRDGILLLKHIGFTEIESNTENRNFIIDVEKTGIPLLLHYKEAYKKSMLY